MVQIKFIPDNKIISVDTGTTILRAARNAGVVIEAPCNENVTCGKCKVKLDSTSIKNVISTGAHHLSKEEVKEGFVLSCATKVVGDVLVYVTSNEQNESLKILNHGKSFDFKVNPIIKKKYFDNEGLTRVYADKQVIGIEANNTENVNFGVVVDIGTTTMVASLIDLSNGVEVSSISSLNPQAIHAQDVLSRIKFASEEDGLNTMYSGVTSEIKNMISETSKNAGVDSENIYEVILSGNTCMIHLATNINPSSLGKYPYTPKIYGGNHVEALQHDFNISPFGLIYLPPIISAYVGPDITSGILAAKLYEKDGNTLFVDIGTNGEMVLSLDGELSAASTAAGPAFEGMNITHGMRASNGAIEFFNIEDDGNITVKTIGNEKAIGICGSGLFDIVGELVKFGVIKKNGKFVDTDSEVVKSLLKEKLVKIEGKTVFKITDSVYLSQKDIRQVQLAKGAVRAGIEFLLRSKDITAERVDKVLIAGSFGYHLRAKSLINIGLLPWSLEDKIDFVGNTSKSGGQIFLLNKSYREQMESVVKKVDIVELSNYKDFDKVFVQCLSFK
ncbi:MAG: ASKHA domain-containing protein [Clostridiaceae bacterium]|nr:ASKHA domain-containing protein [Clostridiaceae bacterium]